MSSLKEKTDITISVIVVLIALAFILFYSLSGDTSFLKSTNKNETISILIIEEKTYSRIEEPEDLEEVIITDKKERVSEIDSSAFYPIDTLVNERDNYKKEVDRISDNTRTIETKNSENLTPKIRTFKVEDEMRNDLEKNDFNDGSAAVDTQLKVEEIAAKDLEKNCVILIGSFTKNKNSNKLKNELKEDGYDIFEVPYKNLVRIGIYSLCDNDILSKELKTIREKYASDAIIFSRN